MKKIIIFALLWTSCIPHLLAQSTTIERSLAVPANNKVNLQLKFGNEIKITAWDKKEASIKVTYEINSGKLNEALLLAFDSDSESARLSVDFDQELLKTGKKEDCPDSNHGGGNVSFNGHGSYTCSDINYEIFLPRNADLTVETINGDIEIRGLTGPVQAKSISGFVDMNWPQKSGAAVSLKTITGEVYSDLDIAIPNKEKAPIVGYRLKGDLNGGGATIRLESISNDIYLRKQ